ncbi:MAG: hypothetical protein CMG00_09065 [Candidatus Marinimicrobia bacterium]|nr:hypothetical protein [Candidatus Neomarinimicrobiota bacterium]
MKILYIGVHDYKNETKWRSETSINASFNKNGIQTIRLDYRSILKNSDISSLKDLITSSSKECDVVFLQRGDNLNPEIFNQVEIPIIFWSTEPINLKNDIDLLLHSKIFSWVYLHTYGCLQRVEREFQHITDRCSVLHNALPKDRVVLENQNFQKEYFAIFNRNLSLRRRRWLLPSWRHIKIIKNHYGDLYFQDLAKSHLAINVHYSSKNLDDFETGIFEAIASGSVVLSETLDQRVLQDLNLNDAIIQFDSPKDLKQKLIYYKHNLSELDNYRLKSQDSIDKNTWDYRMSRVKDKFLNIMI